MSRKDIRAEGRKLGFFLTDGFALMSYAAIVEPFRAANVLAGRELYRWFHVSVNGRPVAASNGATILADRRVGGAVDCDTLFVFAAGDPARFDHRQTFAWLRRLAQSPVRLAGISGGPYLMARAGVLEGHRATIHWDHRAAFEDDFPTLSMENSLYVIDRRRITCAGGTAGLDLAIEMIERDHGHKLAAKVSEWFIRTEIRAAARPQRLSLRERYGIRDDRVLRVLALMEAQVDAPPTRADLARSAGLSVRQLDRLFVRHLDMPVQRVHDGIRLGQAQLLVERTNMALTDIALACGFETSAHFSRAFKRHFGIGPRAMRAGDAAAVPA
jgi:transcriptional regulator GlxA family with amidase domain